MQFQDLPYSKRLEMTGKAMMEKALQRQQRFQSRPRERRQHWRTQQQRRPSSKLPKLSNLLDELLAKE